MPGNPLERRRPKGVRQETWEHNRFEDAKREAWKREPLVLLGVLVRNIEAGHYKGKLGRTLMRAGSEVYMAIGYHERDEDSVPDTDPEERYFADIDQVVSDNSRDGLMAFAEFLRETGKAFKEAEDKARTFPHSLVPGSDARLRRGLLIYLKAMKEEQTALAPTLDQIMEELSQERP